MILLSRGPDVRLPVGSAMELIIERDIQVDMTAARARTLD